MPDRRALLEPDGGTLHPHELDPARATNAPRGPEEELGGRRPSTPATERADVVVVGGGILGLATAYRLLERRPDLRLVLLEREPDIALHQTGHNSGV
ncbi:MAG TPA: FAD-dependent oxidoreductase, partial [Candidatus Binatia bacterium]|nr:FAD-dependent oxidoreductase [Candidatus Binatia bacterium]